jgi:signal transduction histidine kinase
MFRRLVAGFVGRILSVPIFLKILGIGFLTALIFGGVTLLQTRTSINQILYQLLEKQTASIGLGLADTIERPASVGDIFAVRNHLLEARKSFPDIRYIIVRDRDGNIVASTFENGVPLDLVKAPPPCPPNCSVRTLGSSEGVIMDVHYPVAGGFAGVVQLGVLDRMVHRELSGLTRTVLWGLILCASVGICLALLLTDILTRPIRHLVVAANRIRHGELETRAEVFYSDEIGRLAIAFNQMAEALSRYQMEVQAKEKARLSLIERIVQVQEDERKSISRELHDHFGQSLLALLLQVQAGCQYGQAQPCGYSMQEGALCLNIEKTIRQIIAEVHRLAWGMRPSILDDYGLDSALARHIEEVSKNVPLQIDYQFTSPEELSRLPSRIEVPLFRIAQEAITNMLRHANASHASVVILRQLREITLLIEDDGQGFDLAMARSKGDKCLGLMGMKERVNLLGGSFVIESAPGEGTTIRVKIPLNEE